MKAATILSLATLALGSVIEQRACAGNNCNRQVTGTRAGLLPLESRSADCSQFQKVEVTRVPSIVTVIAWETEGATPQKRADVVVEERQVAPEPTVPAYASSCRDDAAYASACECFGIPPWTTTVGPRRSYTTVASVATDCPAYAATAAPACAQECWTEGAAAAGCATDDLECQCNPDNYAVIGSYMAPCVAPICPVTAQYDVHYVAENACACHAATATPAPTPL